jgi:hypothetical protein
MPDVSVLIKQIRQARTDLENALPELAIRNTINGKALAERKIREIGFGAKYSNNRVPAWYFLGEWKSKAGEAYVLNKQAYDEKNAKIVDGEKIYADDAGVTWAEMRQAEGLQSDHVDLGFTNKMWAGLIPEEPYFEGGKIVCRLAGNTVEVINKLSWNFKHYGDFFSKVFTETEVNILAAALAEEVKIILINNGFKK